MGGPFGYAYVERTVHTSNAYPHARPHHVPGGGGAKSRVATAAPPPPLGTALAVTPEGVITAVRLKPQDRRRLKRRAAPCAALAGDNRTSAASVNSSRDLHGGSREPYVVRTRRSQVGNDYANTARRTGLRQTTLARCPRRAHSAPAAPPRVPRHRRTRLRARHGVQVRPMGGTRGASAPRGTSAPNGCAHTCVPAGASSAM